MATFTAYDAVDQNGNILGVSMWDLWVNGFGLPEARTFSDSTYLFFEWRPFGGLDVYSSINTEYTGQNITTDFFGAPLSGTYSEINLSYSFVDIFQMEFYGVPLGRLTGVNGNLVDLRNPALRYTPLDGDDSITGAIGNDILFGRGGNDIIFGRGGNDNIDGGSGNDVLDGGTGNDTLNGDAGNDVLDGRSGTDIMNGGLGNDTFYWDNVADQIIELAGGGTDQIRSFISIDLGASAGLQQVERGYVYGQANATIFGNNLANVLAGNDGIGGVGGNNRLEGRGGADIINGGGGNDFIIGGTERDVMTGGTGRDGFRFITIAEAGNGAGTRDIITDFATSTQTGSTLTSDYIDLGLIDANLTNATHTFAFIGFNTAFTAAGQLRYRHEGGNTLIEGNVNADLGADFQIQLNGLKTLVVGDFIL